MLTYTQLILGQDRQTPDALLIYNYLYSDLKPSVRATTFECNLGCSLETACRISYKIIVCVRLVGHWQWFDRLLVHTSRLYRFEKWVSTIVSFLNHWECSIIYIQHNRCSLVTEPPIMSVFTIFIRLSSMWRECQHVNFHLR